MDISAVLISLLQGHPWSGSAVALLGIFGYILTHVFPMLPKPAATTGAWAAAYPVLSFLSGNWGGAAPTVANLPVGTQAAVIGPSGAVSVGTAVVPPPKPTV